MTTGQIIKQRRKELKIPVEEIAKVLNVSVATVYRYENGEIEKVPGAALDPLARILQTTPAALMGWEKEKTPSEEGVKLDDFTYALFDEAKDLTDADKEMLLGMAKMLKERKDKEQ